MIALMLRAVVVVCGVGLWVACDRSGGPDGGAPPVASAPERDGAMRSGPRAPGPEDHQMKGPLPDPHVPQRADAFSPALTQLAEPGPPNLEVLSERESCAQCHAGIVSEWQESMHAFSSMNNPFYVVSFDPFVADSGHTKGRFCNGCHEPAFLFKETPATIEPTDPLAYAGVGCGTCHGAVEATSDGNASYTLTTQPVPVPKPGDDASLAAHRARVGADTLRSDALCVSCHRAFLSPDTGHDVFVNGADEFGPWRRSAYAGSRATRIDAPAESHSCTSCHMPKAKGAVSSTMTGTKSHASHRFPGGHTTMAHGLGADLQMEAVEAMLRSAATLDIVALASNNPKGVLAPVVGSAGVDGPAEMKVSPKRPLAFDVVIFNKGVGHQFPGGVRDLRDTWVEALAQARAWIAF
ncbi:MAG: multiheme c-type cytochrome [Myxococcota bacterium]